MIFIFIILHISCILVIVLIIIMCYSVLYNIIFILLSYLIYYMMTPNLERGGERREVRGERREDCLVPVSYGSFRPLYPSYICRGEALDISDRENSSWRGTWPASISPDILYFQHCPTLPSRPGYSNIVLHFPADQTARVDWLLTDNCPPEIPINPIISQYIQLVTKNNQWILNWIYGGRFRDKNIMNNILSGPRHPSSLGLVLYLLTFGTTKTIRVGLLILNIECFPIR